MLSKLKQKYAALRPDQQHKATIAMFIGGAATFACLAYFISGSSAQQKPVDVSVGVPEGKTVLNMDGKLLEKSMTQQQAQDKQELEELKKKMALLEGTASFAGQQPNPLAPNTQQGGVTPNAGVQQLDQIIQQQNGQSATMRMAATPAPTKRQRSLPSIPPPAPAAPAAAMPTSFTPPPPPAGAGSPDPYYQAAPVERRRVGGIGVAVNETAAKESTKATAGKDDDAKKKAKSEKQTVYLPPSFMEATTLSGLNALTSDAGRSNPMPVFIRIGAPAQLPNEVKANLKGCFVIGEAIGSLSDHRAHVRLVSISCLSKKEQAVIDQDITGYVQDDDGGIGLSGKVVWKAGATVARLAAVGLLKGIGESMSNAATSSNVTALGQINTIGTTAKDIGLVAAGSAISNSSKGLVKIYEDLTLGSLPVIEIGNHKKIRLMITKGVQLEIKNYKTMPWH